MGRESLSISLESGPGAGNTVAVDFHNVQQIVRSALLVGTKDPRLEGTITTAAAFAPDLGVYQVKGIMQDGETLTVRPENVLLPPRTTVTIKNVPQEPKLLGCKGRIVGIENAKQMYTVRLENNEHIMLQYGAVVA